MCGAVFALASAQPSRGLSDAGWPVLANGTVSFPGFRRRAPLGPAALQPAKFLPGIGAQTFARGATPVALAEADMPQIAPNIEPVAWDRLSAGDCITVTAKSGQTLSFRILGARPAGKPDQAGASAKIELAVSACADMGEPVAKAVIQPTTPPTPKAANVERTL